MFAPSLSSILSTCAYGVITLLVLVASSPAHADEPVPAPRETTLTLATYNLKMLPTALSPFTKKVRSGQAMRAPWIVDYLNGQPFDVVVMQELFDTAITKQIMVGIEKAYPYQIAPKSSESAFKGTSGVLVASRLPLKELGSITFEISGGVETAASKGCVLAEMKKDGIAFQLAGTHMQTGKDLEKNKHFSRMRDELLVPNARPGVPQFLLGDMNITKGTPAYADMMRRLQLQDFDLDDPRPQTAGDPNNFWNKEKKRTEGHQLDYILLDPQGTETTILKQTILRPTREHEGKQIDLSDHYGVAAEIRLVAGVKSTGTL